MTAYNPVWNRILYSCTLAATVGVKALILEPMFFCLSVLLRRGLLELALNNFSSAYEHFKKLTELDSNNVVVSITRPSLSLTVKPLMTFIL